MRYFPLDKWRGLQVALLDPRLSERSKAVFGRLIEHHNHKTGLCCPSEETIAEALSCSDRTVRTAIRQLEKFDYLETIRGGRMNGTNRYLLVFPIGKNEFKEAERFLQWLRKKLSAKPKKKPKDKPLHPDTKKSHQSSEVECEREYAKKREVFEKNLVGLLGGDEAAWLLVQNAPKTLFENAMYDILEDQIPIEVAASRAFSVLHSGPKKTR